MVALMCCCCQQDKPRVNVYPLPYVFRLESGTGFPSYYSDFCREHNLNWDRDGLFYIQLAIHGVGVPMIYIICWAGKFFYLPIRQRKYVPLSDLQTDAIDPLIDDAFSRVRAFDLGVIVRSYTSDVDDILPASEILVKIKECANRLFSSALSVSPGFRETDGFMLHYIPKELL